MNKIIVFFLGLMLLFTMNTTVTSTFTNQANDDIDFDPLVDIEVTVEIKTIRYLEDATTQLTQGISTARKRSDLFEEWIKWILNKDRITEDKPNMYVKVFINDLEFISPVYNDTYYVYEPDFSATLNVPNNVELVNITIQLWHSGQNCDKLLDISPAAGKYEADMVYSVKTGHWTGDNYLGAPSGYGRLNGCDDGSIYKNEGDCELWFDIYQNTYDGSGIPYWMQVYEYGIDPTVDNTGTDYNDDGIPIEWEWKYGYNPFGDDDHKALDPSGDAITNYYKYLTWNYGSDPFRKEVFVKMDIMQTGPNCKETYFPEGSIELMKTAFNRQNVMLYVDTGKNKRNNTVPFYDEPNFSQIRDIYNNYFIRDENESWHEDVFHYAIILYNVAEGTAPGFSFRRNAFIVASQGMEKNCNNPFFGSRDVIYASAFIHELGHTFGFWPIPGHNLNSIHPLQLRYWYNLAYNSCMNYAWMFMLVDYSDGSGSRPDLNDWQRINYNYFKGGLFQTSLSD
jgi:hypothetical protein